MKNYLENPALVFSIAIALGLLFPQFSFFLVSSLIPVLILSMVLSMREIKFNGKAEVSKNFSSSFKAVLFNYGLLSGLILVLALLFLFFGGEVDYFYGLIILAAIPPAVAIVPFTYLLKGNFKIAVLGEIFSYLLSLVIAPLLVMLFIGKVINISELVKILILLVLLPLLISRPLAKIKSSFFLYSKSIINLGIALVTYIIVGLNQSVLVSLSFEIFSLVIVVFIRTWVIGTLVFLILRKILEVEKRKTISYSLFSVYKNCGVAAAIAVSLLGAKAALPATLSSIFEVSFMIYFKKLLKEV